MGLNITLQNERGEQLGEVIDSRRLLLILVRKSKVLNSCCLRFIDPYGDTVFNGLQMDQFLSELASLHTLSSNAEEEEILSKIEELANLCKREPHRYIKIYGD